MGQKIKVAAIQMASTIGDVKGNVNKACRMLSQAAELGTQLVCLPEMFNTGYFSHTDHLDPALLNLAESVHDSWTLTQISSLAVKHHMHAAVPFAEKAGRGVYHNSTALIDPNGAVIGCYRKAHVPWSMTGWEKFYFRPGYDFPVFETPLGRIGIQICYDRDFPEGFRTLALKGADIIVVPSGHSRTLVDIWQQICRVRAYENGLFILGAAATGTLDAEHHELGGHSMVAGPTGDVLALLGHEEGVLTAELDLEWIEEARRKRFILRDRRPEIYSLLSELK